MKIPLANGRGVALVDARDAARVQGLNWYLHPKGYAAHRSTAIGHVLMHRYILGLQPGDPDVDHKDGDKLNNRRKNLRRAGRSRNMANQRKTRGTSQYKGVSWSAERSKWQAHICVDKKRTYLGRFDDERDAARAYNVAAIKAFGAFAKVNAC